MFLQPFRRSLAGVDLERHVERDDGVEAGHLRDLADLQPRILPEKRHCVLYPVIIDELPEIPSRQDVNSLLYFNNFCFKTQEM